MATIQGVYLALFGRPADPAGLAFFNAETKNGADLTAIGDLAATAEYQQRFEGMTSEEIINSIYQSLFERDAEPAGRVFWANALATGQFNINNIAIAILDGAQGDDLATVNAKIAAANLFTQRLDLDAEVDAYAGAFAAQVGREYIAAVDKDDAATAEEADAAIQRLLDGEQGQGPGNGGGGGGGNFSPIASDDAYAVNEDGVLNGASVLANDLDPEGSPLTATLTSTTANGILAFNADGTFTYTPNANFSGADSFTYRANDGEFNSNEVTVTITVNPMPETYDLEPTSTLNVAFNVSEDRLTIDDADVSDTWGIFGGPNLESFTATPNGPFDFGAFNLVSRATSSNAVIEFNNDFSSVFTGAVTSYDLLDALKTNFITDTANGIDVGMADWSGYLVAYADNNAYIFYGDAGAGSSHLSAGEISLVGTLTGVAVGSLTQANFIAG